MEDRAAQDQRAIDAVLQGETGAFEELLTRYQKMVAGIAWRFGFRREDIEDIVSEVFIKAYRNLGRYRPDHPFSTWLYRLAANHTVDHTRRARKERGRTELPEQLPDGGPGPRRELELGERASLVRTAVSELKPHYREAILAVYVEGLKVEQAARVLGVPEGTVKTRLMRGREALRKVLVRRHPEHFGEDDAL